MQCSMFSSNDAVLFSRCVAPVVLCLLPDFFCDCLSPPGCPLTPPFIIVTFFFSTSGGQIKGNVGLHFLRFSSGCSCRSSPGPPPSEPGRGLQRRQRGEDVDGCLVPGLSVLVLLSPFSLFGHSDLDRDFWNNNDSSTVQQRWSSYPPKEFVLNISPYAPYGDPRLTLK